MRPFLPIFGLLVLTALPAQAATVFIASSAAVCGSDRVSDSDFPSVGSAASSSSSGATTACNSDGQASAGLGGLKVRAESIGGAGNGTRASSFASAEMQVRFLLNTPSGYTGGPIPIAANFDLEGIVSSLITPAFDADGNRLELSRIMVSSLSYLIQLNGTGTGASTSDTVSADARDPSGASPSRVEETLDTRLTSGIAMLDPFQEINLRVNFSAQVGTTFFGSFMSGIADGSHTLTFAKSGNVFDLPKGFSVTISEVGIIDNRYVVGPVSPIPLPAAGWALLAALAGLFQLRRRSASSST